MLYHITVCVYLLHCSESRVTLTDTCHDVCMSQYVLSNYIARNLACLWYTHDVCMCVLSEYIARNLGWLWQTHAMMYVCVYSVVTLLGISGDSDRHMKFTLSCTEVCSFIKLFKRWKMSRSIYKRAKWTIFSSKPSQTYSHLHNDCLFFFH